MQTTVGLGCLLFEAVPLPKNTDTRHTSQRRAGYGILHYLPPQHSYCLGPRPRLAPGAGHPLCYTLTLYCTFPQKSSPKFVHSHSVPVEFLRAGSCLSRDSAPFGVQTPLLSPRPPAQINHPLGPLPPPTRQHHGHRRPRRLALRLVERQWPLHHLPAQPLVTDIVRPGETVLAQGTR